MHAKAKKPRGACGIFNTLCFYCVTHLLKHVYVFFVFFRLVMQRTVPNGGSQISSNAMSGRRILMFRFFHPQMHTVLTGI